MSLQIDHEQLKLNFIEAQMTLLQYQHREVRASLNELRSKEIEEQNALAAAERAAKKKPRRKKSEATNVT